jgi:general secretion pathway protein G
MIQRTFRRKLNSQTVAGKPRRAGFTLTEVLLVLAILGVIAAMIVPNLIGTQKKAMIDATRMKIKGFEDSVKTYAIANGGEFPQGTREEVIALLTSPSQDADGRSIPPVMESIPKDDWGQPLYYEYPTSKTPNGMKPAIWSSGPNRQNEDGGGDDINNWSQR